MCIKFQNKYVYVQHIHIHIYLVGIPSKKPWIWKKCDANGNTINKCSSSITTASTLIWLICWIFSYCLILFERERFELLTDDFFAFKQYYKNDFHFFIIFLFFWRQIKFLTQIKCQMNTRFLYYVFNGLVDIMYSMYSILSWTFSCALLFLLLKNNLMLSAK